MHSEHIKQKKKVKLPANICKTIFSTYFSKVKTNFLPGEFETVRVYTFRWEHIPLYGYGTS